MTEALGDIERVLRSRDAVVILQVLSRSNRMADVKLVVIYPRPKDVAVFEKVYQREHVPLAVSKLDAKVKIVATRILGSPQGIPPFYRIAEVHFPSMQALEACAASEGGKEVLAHAVKISSGGPPLFLVAEEETLTFTQTAAG
jgi:uncharacterized protein (TIGR02118 family)